MKNTYLLPRYFKKIGWSLFIPFGILSLFLMIDDRDLLNEWIPTFRDWGITAIIIVDAVALIFIAFAKETLEDECISKIRESSLVWSVIINYLILIIGALLFYDFAFLYYLYINIYGVLLIFICKFNYELYRFKKIENND